ncbi:MAG: hypothetical protein WA761_04195 [Thermoplasmata archaeon]
MTTVIPELAGIAALMAIVIARLVKWSAEARNRTQAAVDLFLLGMMAAMFLGAAIYFQAPGPGTLVEGLWVSGALMSVSVSPVFLIILDEARSHLAQGDRYVPRTMADRRAFVAAVIGLVLINELLMGWTFQRVAGGPPGSAGAGLLGVFVGTIVSPWFLFPMALEMALSALWIGRRFVGPMMAILITQPVLMVFAPPALSSNTWIVVSALGSGLTMSAVLTYLLLRVYRGEALAPLVAGYVARLLGSFALMGTGVFIWALDGTGWVFAISVGVQMGVFFSAVLVPESYSAPGPAPAPVGTARSPDPTSVHGE